MREHSLHQKFQFHKGSIRTFKYQDKLLTWDRRFNSIKVQLELSCSSIQVSCTLFQFHKGSIRTFIMNYRKIYEQH